MAEMPITSLGNQNEESEEQKVDFVADPISEEDLEDVSGGGSCNNCSSGCSET